MLIEVEEEECRLSEWIHGTNWSIISRHKLANAHFLRAKLAPADILKKNY